MSFRAFTLFACALFGGAAIAADKPGPNDWPQWRGQNRDGKSPETGLLKSWPKEGPAKAWTARDLGLGFGAPAVVAGKIYVMGSRDGKDGVVALNEADGKELWFTPFDTAGRARPNVGSGSTPTYADGKIYAVSNKDNVVARIDAVTGNLDWSKNFKREFAASDPAWGFNNSALVDGDKVIWAASGDKAGVAALKADSGELLWSTPAGAVGGGAGYSSPMKTTVGGISMYVVLLGQSAGIVGVHAETGKLLWQYKKAALGGGAQIPTPIVVEDRIWFSTAYNDKTAGAALLQLVPEGKDIKVKEIKTYSKADITNHHGGMILADGYVYLGHGQNNGIPLCVDFKTGEIVWKADKVPSGANGSAAYSYADGMLYIRYQNRLMSLVKPSPKEGEHKVVSSFMLPEPNDKQYAQSWAHPVIANGKLYIRDQNVLYCYNIKGTTN